MLFSRTLQSRLLEQTVSKPFWYQPQLSATLRRKTKHNGRIVEYQIQNSNFGSNLTTFVKVFSNLNVFLYFVMAVQVFGRVGKNLIHIYFSRKTTHKLYLVSAGRVIPGRSQSSRTAITSLFVAASSRSTKPNFSS